MSEIVCKLSVNVWISDRPVITWWPVTRSSLDGVRYAAAVNEKGTVRTLERPVPFKRMERVKCIRPGVMEYWWVQPDDQRIDGGERYRQALAAMMSRIEDDMLRAAGRIREMKEALYAGGGMD